MNKKLLKLTGVMAIAFSLFYLFIFVVVHITIPYNYLAQNMNDYASLLILEALSLISAFGGIIFLHYKDLSNQELKKKKGYILAWSIVFFATSGICGIIALIIYFNLLDNIININFSNCSGIDYIEEIKELQKLKEKGLITEEEFTLKKKKILNL